MPRVIHATFTTVGRHRNDPRGIGQVLGIAAAIALFVVLVGLGVFFLYNSLPGQAAGPATDTPPAAAEEAGEADGSVLYIKVVGQASDVLVRVPGGEVLTDQSMTQGQYLSYDQAQLEVTLGDPEAVEVHVNGELMDLSDAEEGYTFVAEAAS